MKKKLVAMLLLAVLSVSSVACGDKSQSESGNSEPSTEIGGTKPESESSESSSIGETPSDAMEKSDQMPEANNTHTV